MYPITFLFLVLSLNAQSIPLTPDNIAVRGGQKVEAVTYKGRADDQLRRNHSTQYISEPEWPWPRLRSEAPGVYESYVDLVPANGRTSRSWSRAHAPNCMSAKPSNRC